MIKNYLVLEPWNEQFFLKLDLKFVVNNCFELTGKGFIDVF
jgi:hypothetical protein